ncbi:TlpA family protein disulfide reductase [Carboxylicivirga mesophila]|uniref:TlpA family protein disulfide reductase n=1 Tax=Carboxylicivirga mesophila TaxID=1166478 RepID=A0ABS5K6M2_9BACT|nr:TlpA disulfide reductase family protein [Carboxylicivirga mesophila]MBS2210639.1 TlpA family protein disulfide reductase [Carboxylicivirga mesophila]
MRLFVLLIALLNIGSLLGQQPLRWVTVKGNAPDYAGYDLVVQKVVNPISMEMADLMVVRVNEKGDFEQSIELAAVTHASIDMGKFRGHIYLEPGQSYELVLPPFKPRTDADRFNPYFVPEEIELGIANADAQGLNRSITAFDNYLTDQYNGNAVRIFANADVKLANHIMSTTDSLHSSAHPYFSKYRQYAYGELRMLAYKRNKRKAIYETFKGDSISVMMPSFIQSFNTYFKGFFNYYFSSSAGEALRDAYAKGASFDSLSSVLQKDTLFADGLFAELLLLKGFYDGFYSGRYEQETIIRLFKEATEQSAFYRIREIAAGLHKQVTWLRTGSAAPQFTLYRLDGKERSLSDYEGKFVYLNFMHTSNHTCKEELQLLNVLYKQLRRELTIVTVIMDEDPTAAEQLVKANKFKWDFLHYGAMPKVALDYRIKALPAYFVIDPTQKLRLSPAPSPKESFTPIFMEAQRKYHYEQLRREQPKQKSIYDL